MTLASYSFLMVYLIRLGPSAPSLDEAEKNIVERFNAIGSLAATMTNEETQEKDGKQTTARTVREMEWMRKGKGFLYRAQTRTTLVQTGAGNKVTREITSTTVSDGERVVRLSTQDGRTTAIQRRAEVTETPDVRAMLDRLREDSTLERFPDVKVGKEDCYAIRVLPKEKKGSDIKQTMIYFRKDIGLDVRTVVYDTNNKAMFISTTERIRVNPDFPPGHFTLTLPDGVELIDQTKP